MTLQAVKVLFFPGSDHFLDNHILGNNISSFHPDTINILFNCFFFS